MKKSIKRILALLLSALMVLSVAACGDTAGSSSDGSSSNPDDSIVSSEEIVIDDHVNENVNANDENIKNKVFPMFGNEVDYSRGGPTATEEAYPDYKKDYLPNRYEYADMVGHDSEVSAVRLAELGIFSKTENFSPNSSMTVGGFLKALMMACRQDINGKTSNADLKAFIDGTNFLEEGVTVDYDAVLTNELMAYFLSRANETVANAEQYKLLIEDFSDITEAYRDEVLQTVAVGIIEIVDFKFDPKAKATRAAIADGIYRLINTGARVIPLYDIGNLYVEGENEYLVKNSYLKNEAGVQFGFFCDYNKQNIVFDVMGKIPIDRTGFNKWQHIETQKGVYNWHTFFNDASPHKSGMTSIICIDITANLRWNPMFNTGSNIPSFYEQDITDPTTRAAAKRFLYAFVQQMLSVLEGDVLLLIDYELDWQQAIWDNGLATKNRANEFSKWFCEACEVAREAAKQAGYADRLKLGVNYNNITGVHRTGVNNNQWMINMAKAADYVTIDSYQFYDDKSDPSYTIQNLRFLMNNYSLGKPVMMVENGMGVSREPDAVDPITGLHPLQVYANYFTNLYREFRFECARGGYLNANLDAYLIWDFAQDPKLMSGNSVASYVGNTAELLVNGVEVKRGIDLMYKQNQYNPSYRDKVVEASVTAPTVKVSSGTQYESLTYVIADYDTKKADGKLRVKLDKAGFCFITVNGVSYQHDGIESDSHVYELEGMRDGTNVIEIYFGAEEAPSTRTVEKVLLS